jgi:hypothetical protein
MFTHNKQNLNSEGWKVMTQKSHFFRFVHICSKKGIHCCDCQRCNPNNEEVSLISGDCNTVLCVAGWLNTLLLTR